MKNKTQQDPRRCRRCSHLIPQGDGKYFCEKRNKVYAYRSVKTMKADDTNGCEYKRASLDAISGKPSELYDSRREVEIEFRCYNCGRVITSSEVDNLYCEKCLDKCREEDKLKIKKNLDDRKTLAFLANAVIQRAWKDYTDTLEEIIKKTKKLEKQEDSKKRKFLRDSIDLLLDQKHYLELYFLGGDYHILNLEEYDIPKLILEVQKMCGYDEDKYGA